MPVRFRCAYCNQLLGIARRKSGSVVRCPTCAGQIVVPVVDQDETERHDDSAGSVFERNDFEEILNGGSGGPVLGRVEAISTSAESPLPAMTAAPADAWGTHADIAFDMSRGSGNGGVFRGDAPIALPVRASLSPAKLAFLIAGAVLALAISFGAGVLVGYQFHNPEPVKTSD